MSRENADQLFLRMLMKLFTNQRAKAIRTNLARLRTTAGRRRLAGNTGGVLHSGVAQTITVVGGGAAGEKGFSTSVRHSDPSILRRWDVMPFSLEHHLALPVA